MSRNKDFDAESQGGNHRLKSRSSGLLKLVSWITGAEPGASQPSQKATKAAAPGRKPVNLALQGGGAHGAFTWGVLDTLLQDGRLEIAGISGASAGAVNGVLLIDGLMKGGEAEARKRLADFWRAASVGGNLPNVQRQIFQNLFESSPMKVWLDAMNTSMGKYLSPYDLNPLNINPLQDLIRHSVDFDAIRKDWDRPVFISATNVESGRLRVFSRSELTAEVIMASACLPFLFRAVEIEGESYWDGGYLGNPVLTPFLQGEGAQDLLIVQINPLQRRKAPTSARDIMGRVNEITFNASLTAELRVIATVNRLLEQGQLQGRLEARSRGDESQDGESHNGGVHGAIRPLRVHRIVLEDDTERFDAGSRLKTDYDFFDRLRRIGQDAARDFLSRHFDDIGRRGTVDLEAEEHVAAA